jgi:hypothetical protein
MFLRILHLDATKPIVLDRSHRLSSKINFFPPSQKASLDCFYGSNPLIHEQEYAWEMHR